MLHRSSCPPSTKLSPPAEKRLYFTPMPIFANHQHNDDEPNHRWAQTLARALCFYIADAKYCSQVTFNNPTSPYPTEKKKIKIKTSPLFSAEWTGTCGTFEFPAPSARLPHAPLAQGGFMLSTPASPFKAPPPIKYSSLTGIKGAMQFKDYQMPLIM